MDLEDDADFFPRFVKRALDRATVAIVEKLEPKELLDIFMQRMILGEVTNVKIRDIKEERYTSDQNRAIQDMVRRSGTYIIFKEGLASTGQQELLNDLEAIEKEMHDSLKEPHQCSSTESCHLFQQLKHKQIKIPVRTSKPVADDVDQQADVSGQYQVLQQYLLRLYGKRKFWENPVSSEEAFLSQMYVQPSVKSIKEIDDQGTLAEVKQRDPKITYGGVFLSKTGPCENIYLTGDAGKGKTTFCNQLLLQWCNAVQNIQTATVSPEDLKVLASFRFLFHITLRDTETIYHVEDMLQEQLINAPVSLNISDILKTERCLIVLDGLDEWSCPDNAKTCPDINKHIPGRNTAHTNCVFLTTTRPWKYDVIALKNKDVDKYIELCGIGDESSEELTKKVLDNLDKKSKTRKHPNDFYNDVRAKKLDEFLHVPVLLIQLLTLWHAGKDFGNSQLQLYCSMLELLFERSEKNLPDEISKCSITSLATPERLPECFRKKDNCKKYAELLHCLASLAYQALFNKHKEEALVFTNSRLDIFGISPSDIKLCLHCGVLSQCRDYGNYTGKYKKFSFLHKKVQECLAALYLVTNDNVEDNLKEIKQFCNSVETMLEMSQVWLFVAGMEPDMTRRLFERLGDVVSSDEQVKTYRQTLGHASLIRHIQSLTSDCVSEGINNGHHYENLCLEDFLIDSFIVNDVERLLFCSDMSQVKSVYMGTGGIDAAKVDAIIGQFQQCGSIQKLRLYEPMPIIPDSTVANLVQNSCASLTSLDLCTEIKATDELVAGICCSISNYLMALILNDVKLTHKHKEQILQSLSKSPSIRQLDLRLYCTNHGNECSASIDWSAMTQLQELYLRSMFVDNLQSLPHGVEKIVLRFATLPMTSLRDFARGLNETSRTLTVELYSVTFTDERECVELKDVLLSCPSLRLKECEYEDRFNIWYIEFHTSSQ